MWPGRPSSGEGGVSARWRQRLLFALSTSGARVLAPRLYGNGRALEAAASMVRLVQGSFAVASRRNRSKTSR
jgi:hypothetical protein